MCWEYLVVRHTYSGIYACLCFPQLSTSIAAFEEDVKVDYGKIKKVEEITNKDTIILNCAEATKKYVESRS